MEMIIVCIFLGFGFVCSDELVATIFIRYFSTSKSNERNEKRMILKIKWKERRSMVLYSLLTN